ncbi:CHC2 zinc finger domain-containing protein [Diplocloster modestus]|uniref:DNA primase n=1 Tax=Diplocloster modestus TaxID=2850322 RepID=A0ABS6KC26_9FIRM|nr:DNA primase [Diplocloster modestus]
MTTEEIKQSITMREVAERYNIKVNRNGFCRCIYHDEKTPSMKLYRDSFYCFSCQKSGDIFTFMQMMDGLSFQEAFRELGGTYEHSFRADLKVYHAQKRREMVRRQEEKLRQKKELNILLIDVYRRWTDRSEPLSDTWCDCYKALQLELYHHMILNGPEER